MIRYGERVAHLLVIFWYLSPSMYSPNLGTPTTLKYTDPFFPLFFILYFLDFFTPSYRPFLNFEGFFQRRIDSFTHIQRLCSCCFILNENHLLQNGDSGFYTPWDWGHIGVRLGTKHVIYQKLKSFM